MMRRELQDLYLEYFKREDMYIRFEKARLHEERKNPDQKLKELEKELGEVRDILAKSSEKDAKSDELLELESKLHTVRLEQDEISRTIGRIEGQIATEERILRKQNCDENY